MVSRHQLFSSIAAAAYRRYLRPDDELKILKHHYNKYVKEVSTPDMAISLNTGLFLYYIGLACKPQKILDLGSGYSSFVFRLLAQNTNFTVEVTSIDDSAEWLYKTRRYLQSCELNTDKLYLWDDFLRMNQKKSYDLIFHDLGDMSLRANSFPTIFNNYMSNTSLLILDDMHKDFYRSLIKEYKRNLEFRIQSLFFLTNDQYGRYSAIVTKLK